MKQRVSESNKIAFGIFITLFAATAWGFSGACSEYLFIHKNADSSWLTMVRMLSSGAVLLIFLRLRGATHSLPKLLTNPLQVRRLLLFSIFGLMSTQFSYLLTISLTNSGTATVLQYTAPVFILIWSCLTDRRIPKGTETLAIVLVLFGVFMLATNGDLTSLVLSKEGLFWGIISAVTLAIYTVLPLPLIQQHGSIVVSALGMCIGGLVFTLLARPFYSEILLDFSAVLAILGLVLIGTVLSFTIFLYGVSLIGAVRGSIIAAIEPVSAALFSHFWLGTTFTFQDVIGFAAILSAVLALSLIKKTSKSPVET